MTIRAFFTIPLVQFGVHAFLVVGVGLNVYQFYRTWQVETNIQANQRQIDVIRESLNDFRSEKNYLTSDLFKEKQMRDLNLKKNGEEVLDSSSFEKTRDESQFQYAPSYDQLKPRSNPQKWWECFFGTDRDMCVQAKK